MMVYMPYSRREDVPFSELYGQTLLSVKVSNDNQEIEFNTVDGRSFVMHHDNDCCESVQIESIVGEIEDLIGSPILVAEEVVSPDQLPEGFNPEDYESFTWTFYKLATFKGYVDIRWFGESNGYYSESVDFTEILPEQ